MGCAADRPAHEIDDIEITEDMIQAGLSELCSYGPEACSVAEDVVREIFTAMLNAHHRHHVRSSSRFR